MKQVKLITITTIISIASLTACQKDNTTVTTPEEVKIEIASPNEGDVFKKGDTVSIAASINSNTQMHGYIVRISYAATGEEIYDTEGHTHEGSLSVHEQWVNTMDTTVDLQIEVIGVIDHDENQKTKTVGIKCQH